MEISGFRNLAADLIGEHKMEGEYWGVDEMECSLYEMNEQAMMEMKPYSSEVGDNDRPLKQMRSTTTNWSSPYSHTPPTIATSFNFNFASTSTPSNPIHQAFVLKSTTNTHHSLAERKRREKISQSFMDLSALLPCHKKMDKASVLEDAIEYMKELEAKVKRLEEKAKKKTMSMESVRFTINKDDDDGGGGGGEKSVMEARFGEKELLISIECEARKGVFERVVGEVEKHHLSLLNTSVLTYGNSSLSITLIAQKNEECGNVSMEQLVRNLQGVLKIIL